MTFFDIEDDLRDTFDRESAALVIPDRYWRMGNGKLLSIAAMKDSHLINAIKFTQRNWPYSEEKLNQWPPFKGLIKEAKRRKLHG